MSELIANYLLVFCVKDANGAIEYVNMLAAIDKLTGKAVRAYERHVKESNWQYRDSEVALINAIRLETSDEALSK